jgi:lipoprotein-anchoring transpeptidase ErfK/SrfK
MKVYTLLVLVGFVTLNATARAEFSVTDSKHPHLRSAGPTEADYARFEWLGGDDASSVNRIIVSLADQRLYAYHDHQLLTWSNVSSGRTGHETPTGAFCVSEKDADHHSSLYDDASMPFFMRLTDSGVGLHAGWLPGFPASHGCVRLPFGMARELFQRVDPGTPVEIISPSAMVSATQKPATGLHLAQD